MSIRLPRHKMGNLGRSGWNHRSKDVTALRKSNELEAAYALAIERIADSEADEYDRAAYAWCLIALVKRHSTDGQDLKLSDYLEQLRRFEVPNSDEMLAEHREKALSLVDPDQRALQSARHLSKQGQHHEAEQIYAELATNGKLKPDDKKAWGWEIYRLIKGELEAIQDDKLSPPVVQRVKRKLQTYLQLSLEGPDLLHSLILKQALRLAKAEKLKLLPFLRLWNPDLFSDDDFTRQTGKDGKSYPSLVEQAIQAAAAEAVASNHRTDQQLILPHVQAAMKRFPDNIWLKLSLTKLLREMGCIDEALKMAVDFTREKASEYWAWELIGDLVPNDNNLMLACYAKALSCSQDDDFVGKVRIKFAVLLVGTHPAEARYEAERVLAHRKRSGYPMPRDAQNIAERLAEVNPKVTDRVFYSRFSGAAEELLFSHIPWTQACLGDVFTIPGRDGQKPRRRRRIYVKGNPVATELSLSDTHADILGLAEGTPLKVQYETSKTEQDRATIHRISRREEGSAFDIMPPRVGIIDHINHEKSLIHVIVARNLDGTCPISLFPGRAQVGATVAVRLAQHNSKQGLRRRIIEIAPTEATASPDVSRPFRDATNVTPSGLGFTLGDIFIPPHMVTAQAIQAGDLVEGIAIASFDKKRRQWGMKAIQAKVVARNHYDFDNDLEADDDWD